MNTRIKKSISIVMTQKRWTAAVGIFLLALLVVLSYVFIFSPEDSSSNMISGKVFIDGETAPLGTNVSIVFHNGVIIKTEGTNETGVYRADLAEFSGESFNVYININGLSYIGTDASGLILNVTVVDRNKVTLNVYVDTTDETEFNDSDETNDDSSDDTNDSGSNGQDDSGSDDSDNDDTNDSGDSNEGGSGNDSDGGGSDDNDGSDDADNNDSGSDTPSDNENQENESFFLSVEKWVWNTAENEWSKLEIADTGDIVLFNVNVTYKGSNLSLIQLSDVLPDGLLYYGNITVDGSVFEPVEEPTQYLEWNVSGLNNQNTTFHILYNVSVLQKDTFENSVTVQMIKNETVIDEKESSAMIQVYGDLLVSTAVKDADEDSWDNSVSVEIGETVRCNVSIEYDGSNVLSTLSIVDKIPDGLEYFGNATVNGQNVIPDIIEGNKTLVYNLSNVQEFENIFFEFDLNVTKNATLENKITVSATETTGKQFDIVKKIMVFGNAIQLLNCEKEVRIDGTKWKDTVNAFVGDTATFQITVTNYDALSLYNLAIVDTMPAALEYVSGSAVLLYENYTFYKEPVVDSEQNKYFWVDINKVNFDPNETGYFTLNDTIILQYDVEVIAGGISINTVNVNSSPCGAGCEPLTGKDSAIINASVPLEPLNVEIVVPSPVYVGEIVQISVNIEGGISPYNFTWDLDTDGYYNDSYAQSFPMQWDNEGTYVIRVNVTDNNSVISKDSEAVFVTYRPVQVNAGGPYYADPNELIHFQGSASGGIGNYTWLWDFDDGTISKVQYPQHAFLEVKEYYITLRVTDGQNESVSDMTVVYVEEPDDEPPMIMLDTPVDAIYVRNKAMIPFFKPFIIGSIDINITVIDNDSSVERIELYINSELISMELSDSLNYQWNEQVFGKQLIIVKAFDTKGNWLFYEKEIWKFF